ncbi:hypothetical protein QU38_00240, partial [Staphylococcus aureus]
GRDRGAGAGRCASHAGDAGAPHRALRAPLSRARRRAAGGAGARAAAPRCPARAAAAEDGRSGRAARPGAGAPRHAGARAARSLGGGVAPRHAGPAARRGETAAGGHRPASRPGAPQSPARKGLCLGRG